MWILRDPHLFNLQHLCHSCKIPPEWIAGHKLHTVWTQCKNHFVKLYNEYLRMITSFAAHCKMINHTQSFHFCGFALKLIIKASAIPDQNGVPACFYWCPETREMLSEPHKILSTYTPGKCKNPGNLYIFFFFKKEVKIGRNVPWFSNAFNYH